MSDPIPDIIESLVGKVHGTYKLTSITDNTDGTSTIKMCHTLWALECNYINIAGIDYKIISIKEDEEIIVQGVPIGTEFTLANPFFIHGTPTQTNIERSKIRRNNVKVTPLFYLFEPIKETFNQELNPIEREVTVRIAVLNNYKKDQFTDKIYDYSIRAMRKYSEQFIETVKQQDSLLDTSLVSYSFESFAKYGNYITNKGSEANIFNEELSGIEIFLTISLKKQDFCLNLCNI